MDILRNLNTSKISTIASFKAEQGYTASVLTLKDASFPTTGDATVANLNLDSRISYNASTPNMDPDGFQFVSDNSQLIVTGDSVESSTSTKLTDAKMTVTANRIVLEVTIDGKRHKVSYTGDLKVEDVSGENGDNGDDDKDDNVTGGQEKEAKTTLTSDHHVTFDGEHRAKWGYEGDYWQVGYSNYTIFIMNKSNGYVYGDTLQLDIITNNQSKDGDFYGEYTCSYTPGKNVMMAGFTNNYAQSVGTWLFDYASASAYNGYAMIINGTLKITNNGDGTSTVILDAYDCLNNNITCNWTGIIEKD